MNNDENQPNDEESNGKTLCTCTHATHFLGRCQREVTTPAHLCQSCMQTHFNLADDPTI